MFALHETTRKHVCRTAFFALCLAPTLCTGWWIAGRHWPGRHGRLARELSDTLDLHVKLAGCREPRPRLVRASAVALCDAESAHSLANLQSLEVGRRDGVRTYRIQAATIEAGCLKRIAEKIFAWVTRLPPETHELQCDKLSIRFGEGASLELRNLRARADRDAVGRVRVQLVADAAEPTAAASGDWRLTLAPSTDNESAAKTLTLQTGSLGVPAPILSASVPGFDAVGGSATFTGVVSWVLDQAEVQGLAQGRLDDVDLSNVLPGGSPHALRGRAAIELAELRWTGPRIERLVGAVRAEPAQMSRSLVEAATSAHGFQCRRAAEGAPVAGEPAMLALDLLAIRFQLGGEGLTFWGACPPEVGVPAESLAVSGGQPLLLAPPYYDWPLGALVQTLCARPAAWVPATRAAIELASRLPLPVE